MHPIDSSLERPHWLPTYTGKDWPLTVRHANVRNALFGRRGLVSEQPVDAITTRAKQDGTTITSSLSDTDLTGAASAAAGKDIAFVFIRQDMGCLCGTHTTHSPNGKQKNQRSRTALSGESDEIIDIR